MVKTILWLDDYRNPNEWMDYIKIAFHITAKDPYVIVWAKSYNDFVNHITNCGLPDAIGFDHDLADEGLNEKTGYDAAKFLVDYCIDNDVNLPEFNSQSANPVGKENILNLLNNFKRHVQRKD